jgi:hypothetical protein
MHVVVRHYKSSPELIDELVRRSSDVEELIRGVDGFIAYYLVKTAIGCASISIVEDQAGAEESTRLAAAYLNENLASIGASPPELIEGETVIHFAR